MSQQKEACDKTSLDVLMLSSSVCASCHRLSDCWYNSFSVPPFVMHMKADLAIG